MKKIFEYKSYKEFINEYILTLPKNGRGQFLAIAQTLNCHSTLISQIFKGDRDLSLEQALALCEFYNFGNLEKRFFLTLVEYSRAGDYKLREYYASDLEIQKREALSLENRLNVKEKLDDAELARFYSDSIYSQIHLMTMIDEYCNEEAIAKRLEIAHERVYEIVDFLITCGMVKKENGILKIGPTQTHLSKNSPYIISHHRNWRIKALEIQPLKKSDDLFYSGQIVMAKADFEKVKSILANSLEEIYKIIGPSECEELYALNIDCFEVFK